MFCFTKQKRLLNKSDYHFVFQKPNKVVTPEFIFLYRKNKLTHARLGLALSKKSVAKSHDRNRLKRKLRETFRTKQLPGVDVIILARRGVETIERSKLTNRLDKAWDKLKSLCNV